MTLKGEGRRAYLGCGFDGHAVELSLVAVGLGADGVGQEGHDLDDVR